MMKNVREAFDFYTKDEWDKANERIENYKDKSGYYNMNADQRNIFN